MPDAQQLSLGILFQHLNPKGLYVVEDLTSASDRQKRINEVNNNVNLFGLQKEHILDFEIIESFNLWKKSKEWQSNILNEDEKLYLSKNIHSILFYDNNRINQKSIICAIKKLD